MLKYMIRGQGGKMSVEVITYQDWRKYGFPEDQVVLTISRSKDWSVGLSPFRLGPCKLYNGYEAKNMENAWQFSKVYAEHCDGDEITDRYWEWAEKGWKDWKAHRYPMSKGAIPLFSYWDGERLSYIEARKKIYIPLYYKAVKNTEAFSILQAKHESFKKEEKTLFLLDFDAYRHKMLNMTYKDVVNCEERKMGHAFVLGMALEEPERLEKTLGC
jgi:hypothetical protein